MAAPFEVIQLLIFVTSLGVALLEVVVGTPLEVLLSFVFVVPPLEVVLASGLVAALEGLVYGSLFPLCPVSRV